MLGQAGVGAESLNRLIQDRLQRLCPPQPGFVAGDLQAAEQCQPRRAVPDGARLDADGGGIVARLAPDSTRFQNPSTETAAGP
jgi:hypothetical protein